MRIVVAEDHDILRETIVAVLATQGMQVVGEAIDGRAAVALVRELAPDVILMDLRMPELSGTDATRELLRERPGTKVVMLSAHAEIAWVEASFEAGASGYVLKESAFEDLEKAIAAVMRGERFVSRRIPGAASFVARHEP